MEILSSTITDPSKLVSLPFEVLKAGLTYAYFAMQSAVEYMQDLFRLFL